VRSLELKGNLTQALTILSLMGGSADKGSERYKWSPGLHTPNTDSAVRRSCRQPVLCRISYLLLPLLSGLNQLEQAISGIATCFMD
jgi:hypothetical protein